MLHQGPPQPTVGGPPPPHPIPTPQIPKKKSRDKPPAAAADAGFGAARGDAQPHKPKSAAGNRPRHPLSLRVEQLRMADETTIRSHMARVNSKEEALADLPPSQRLVAVHMGLTKSKFVPQFQPGRVNRLPLEDARGQSICWRIGVQAAESFLSTAGVAGLSDRLFRTPYFRVFFPVDDLYFMVRAFDLRTTNRSTVQYLQQPKKEKEHEGEAPTLRAVLRAIEIVGLYTAAHHMTKDLGVSYVTVDDARQWLRSRSVCHLLCRRTGGGNHVYVRIAS